MHTFTYHNVGQGLFFHAAFLLENDQYYNFVYDCGAIKSHRHLLLSEINDFSNRVAMIDLLVISHFDYDHISGVRDLLSSCSVVEVVLPYLSDEEILMVLLDKKNKVSEMEDWYFDF